jgi:hypothetical protein
MEPVSAIVGALIAGASAALKDTTNQAIKDAYTGLKQLLKERYSFASVALIEKKPDNKSFQKAAEDELKDSNALQDNDIFQMAVEVLNAIESLAEGEVESWGVDVETLKAGRNVLLENISGEIGGFRAKTVEAVNDITLREIHGGRLNEIKDPAYATAQEKVPHIEIGQATAERINIEVNQTISIQRRTASRKQWKNLDIVDYLAIVDDEERREKYAYQLVLYLHRCFKDKGYTSFTGLMRLEQIEDKDGHKSPIYELVSHQVTFTGALRKDWKLLWIPGDEKKEERKRALQSELNKELLELVQTWTINCSIPLNEKLSAVQFTYDPEACKIEIGEPQFSSTAPDDYPGKVKTTSELLVLLSAVLSSSFIINMGNLACANSSYPLFKLWAEILDNHCWKLNHIRVNVADIEEWDYINTAADIEISNFDEEYRDSR